MAGSNGKVRVSYEGDGAHRRAFLRASVVAAGGALVSAGRGRGQEPAHGSAAAAPAGHSVNGQAEAAAKEAFDGLLVAPAAATVNERKFIGNLPTAELDNLREAFRRLGTPGGSVYASWVNVHVNNCQHNNAYIWPWHRAYLYYLEQRLQRALPSASPAVTIPYWAYDTFGTDAATRPFRTLPEPFRQATVNGQANPLFINRPTNINAGTFVLPFSATRTSGLINNSPDFFSYGTNIENGPHNYVHNNMGPTMSNRFFSPNDPIFWLHHSNLDRAWVRWTQVAGHQNPQPGQSASIDFWLSATLPGFDSFPRRLVREFLDVSALQYTYVLQTFAVAINAGREAKSTSGDLEFAAAVRPAAAPEGPALRPVTIRFREVELPRSAVLEVRAFLNYPDANAESSLDDPRCVGVITLYPPHANRGAVDRRLTLDLDATEAVRSLLAKAKGQTKFPLTTVVVPSRAPGMPAAEANAAEPLRYRSVDVVIGD